MEIRDEINDSQKLNVQNNYGFRKPKEQKFHYYNAEFEEYTDVIFFFYK